MSDKHPKISRREFVGTTATAAATAAVLPGFLHPLFAHPQAPKAASGLDQMRAAGAAANIKTLPLRNGLSVLMGSGGNIVVLPGKDGKLLVDSGFSTSQPQLTEALTAISADPLRHVINTHCHLDHVDGNEWMHKAGATIISDERTRTRMSSQQSIPAFNLVVPPSPSDALPTEVFPKDRTLEANGETLRLKSYVPSHTDTDISVFFTKANVLHCGDTLFNGFYPFIDYGTGGNIKGMIAATKENLALANSDTIVVPGHGPVGNRQSLTEFHDMLVAVHEKVAALKSAGRSEEEVVAAKPTAAFDAKWAQGMLNPELFTRLVYRGA
jgi:glyoxylase-like metal-dependent hydrolase (beta-lactamase superfamily II)